LSLLRSSLATFATAAQRHTSLTSFTSVTAAQRPYARYHSTIFENTSAICRACASRSV
jgi:hypothetical protein